MGLFSNYYCSNHDDRLIYVSIIIIEDDVEMSLYIDDKLVDRVSGRYGSYKLNSDDILLNVRVKALGVKVSLYCKEYEIPLKTIRVKKLRGMLSEQEIFNEINPKDSMVVHLKFSNFIIPSSFIGLGSILYLTLGTRSDYYDIPAFILLVVGYHLLYTTLTSRYLGELHRNGHLRELGLIVSIGVTILTLILLSKIFE